jgi:beta-1,4-mannosyltransferase
MRRLLPSRARTQRSWVVSVPGPLYTNAYQRLLYEQLAAHGIALVPGALELGWLRRHPGGRTILHFHFPEFAYRPPGTAPGALEDWRAVGAFGLRLAAARALGYRVIWTVHQVIPHNSRGAADRVASALLACASRRLIVHDEETARACRWLPVRARNIALVPHASYAGVYPPGRNRANRRAAFSLAAARFVFLCFGQLRAYKDLSLLLTAFAQTTVELPDVALVIAGAPTDKAVVAQIERAAEGDRRIRPLIGFVPDDHVAELFGAADATVYPRADGGTAGSLLLSLSLGRPVIAARVPAYQALIGDEAAGWLFTPGDAQSLASTMVRASDPVAAAARGRRALERMAGRDWAEAGRRTAELMLGEGLSVRAAQRAAATPPALEGSARS